MKRISLIFTSLVLALAIALPGCNLLKKADETDDQNTLLLLLGAFWLSQQSSCRNQSGLVICIPPGVPL